MSEEAGKSQQGRRLLRLLPGARPSPCSPRGPASPADGLRPRPEQIVSGLKMNGQIPIRVSVFMVQEQPGVCWAPCGSQGTQRANAK